MKIYRRNENVRMPEYGTPNSACFDIFSYMEDGEKVKVYRNFGDAPYDASVHLATHGVSVHSMERVMIPTGLILELDYGEHVKIYNRSSVPLKMGLSLVNNVGIIDSDYRDEIYITMINLSSSFVSVPSLMKLCQAELCVNTLKAHLIETKDKPLPVASRNGGFGSTGK